MLQPRCFLAVAVWAEQDAVYLQQSLAASAGDAPLFPQMFWAFLASWEISAVPAREQDTSLPV